MTGSGHINADEPILLDYNLENKEPCRLFDVPFDSDLYTATPYRSSDRSQSSSGCN